MTTTQPIVARPAQVEIMPAPQPRDQQRDARADFGRAWLGAVLMADEQMQLAWDKLRDDWLGVKTKKSNSPHTRRNYESAVRRWREFLASQLNNDGYPLKLWQAEARHVRAWQNYLGEGGRQPDEKGQRKTAGLSNNTVNQQLSCVSSYYSFVINEKFLVNGRELCLFIDSEGASRSNPFKTGNIQRSKTTQYHRAKPLSKETTGRLLGYLEKHQATPGGARNYALILTYLLTAYRNEEVVRMRWGDIRPHNTKPGGIIYHWRGKGAKEESEELPARAWHAIVSYLEKTGRWQHGVPLAQQPLHADDPIWLPITTHAVANLRNVTQAVANQPIDGKSALRIFRTALKNAGVANWEKYRIHDLRHTHARRRLEKGDNVRLIQERLHHSNLAITSLYLESDAMQNDHIDVDSEALYQQMRFV